MDLDLVFAGATSVIIALVRATALLRRRPPFVSAEVAVALIGFSVWAAREDLPIVLFVLLAFAANIFLFVTIAEIAVSMARPDLAARKDADDGRVH